MFTIILLILAISLDALSFGLAQGFNKNSIGYINCFFMSVLSTLLFAVPLYLSQLVVQYLDEKICYLLNGIVLLCLGIFYLVQFFVLLQKKEPPLEKKENSKLTLGYCLISTIPISLDAIFTAFLSGYSLQYIIFGVIFYFVITYIALFIPNKIALKMSGKSNLRLEWLSGLIFVVLGLLKIFGI